MDPPTEKNPLEESRDSLEGEHLGPYKILHAIGHGGMGTVYLAVRDDDQYKKRVCVKVAHPEAGSREMLQRMRQERQILASLEHDNIAKVIDGGETPDGRPYFVMEYVDGLSIDTYCDTHRLSVTERLQLFRQVCMAVQYAHRNLIVHRDLKPSNILVTVEGVPKLLDFGIAKLLNPELSAETLHPTRVGVSAMTLEYASPEQIRNEPITTSADVYSLGVTLYEILTGRLPYIPKSRTFLDIAWAICDAEPLKPSSAVLQVDKAEAVAARRDTTPAKLRRRLVGDLDTILLKALRKEPHRRFDSVEQLGEDLRRHLARLPVTAHRDTLAYRARKFVRRNRLVVGFAAAVLILMIALAVQTVRTTRAAERANRESELAQQVSRFLMELFELPDPSKAQGETITAREILEHGAARISGELEGQPEIQARLMTTVGTVYRKLGLLSRAEDFLERAVEILERQKDSPLALAETLSHLGWLHFDQGKFDAAEGASRRALEIRQEMLGAEHPAIAENLRISCGVYWQTGRMEEALEYCERALAMSEEALGPEHPDLGRDLSNLGILHAQRGEYVKAEKLFLRALAIKKDLLGLRHPDVARDHDNLAYLYQLRGQYETAEKWAEDGLEIRREVLTASHPEVARSLHNLAIIHQRLGKLEAAERELRDALKIRREVLRANHPEVAESLTSLGRVLLARSHFDQAERELRAGLAILEEIFGPEHPEVAINLGLLASVRMAQGRLVEAEEAAVRAVEIQEKLLGPRHPDLAANLHVLATVYREQEKDERAEPLYERSLAIYREAQGPEHPDSRDVVEDYAELLQRMGRDEQAMAVLSAASP